MAHKVLFQSHRSITIKLPSISNLIVGLRPTRNVPLLKKMWLKRDTTEMLGVLASLDFYRPLGFNLLQVNI